MDFFQINEQKLYQRFGTENYEKIRPNICKLFEELYKALDTKKKEEIIEMIAEGYYMGKRMFEQMVLTAKSKQFNRFFIGILNDTKTVKHHTGNW